MSIRAKRGRSQGGESAGERQQSESPTLQTSSTATEHSASASVALTPLTAMETSELNQDDWKVAMQAVEVERLVATQGSSWQGWAELENDPVTANRVTISSIL